MVMLSFGTRLSLAMGLCRLASSFNYKRNGDRAVRRESVIPSSLPLPRASSERTVSF
jgi:hypothetical protein